MKLYAPLTEISNACVTLNGREIDFSAAREFMDDELVEGLLDGGYPIDEQQTLLDAYIVEHHNKYGADFDI